MVEEKKACKKCGELKSLSDFGNVKGKNGVVYKVGTCKQCTALYKQEFHQEHKEREYERLKERRKVNHEADLKKYAENADKINERRRKNYEEKKEEINNKRRISRNENKEVINKQKRDLYEKNKEKIHEQRSERSKVDKEYAAKNAERARKWFMEHKEESHKWMLSYYLNNKDKILDIARRYRATPRGKEVRQKMKSARRLLGYCEKAESLHALAVG